MTNQSIPVDLDINKLTDSNATAVPTIFSAIRKNVHIMQNITCA